MKENNRFSIILTRWELEKVVSSLTYRGKSYANTLNEIEQKGESISKKQTIYLEEIAILKNRLQEVLDGKMV